MTSTIEETEVKAPIAKKEPKAKKEIYVPQNRMSLIHAKNNQTAVNVDSIEAMTPKTDKKVTGTFVNIECPGQPGKVSTRLYSGMQYFSQTMNDNEVYTIPYSVARFINERCKYEVHSHLTDDKGQPLKIGKFTARYKFIIES